MTDTEIRAAYVAAMVAKWGESEREHVTREAARTNAGRLLNTLAHLDPDRVDKEMAKEADRRMTAADHRELRQGG